MANLLSSTPLDIISVISKYLDYLDLMSLWLSGSSVLNKKLSKAAENFEAHNIPYGSVISKRPFCPTIIKSLVGLKNIDISGKGRSPIKIPNIMLWLPNQIDSITLSFYGAFKLWTTQFSSTESHESIDHNVDSKYPVLRYLELFDPSDIPLRLFDLLPRSLTCFQMRTSEKLNNMDFIRSLPPNLIDLDLNFLVDSMSEECPPFPPHLQSLSVIVSWPENFVSKLPPSLTKLRISSRNSEIINNLPPLNHLEFSVSRYDYNNFSKLPATLEYLRCDNNQVLEDQHIKLLPRNLTYLELNCLDNNTTIKCAPFLPRSLQNFSFGQQLNEEPLSGSDLQLLAELPPRMTELEFHINIPSQFIALLPKTLKHLSLIYLDDEGATLLPRGLTSLTTDDGCLTASGISSLPRNLKTLCIDLSVFQDDGSSVCLLPHSLENLTLKNNFENRDCKIAESFSLNFPPYLRTLTLPFGRKPVPFSDTFMKGLRRLEHLVSISGFLRFNGNVFLSETTLQNLPPNLRYLSLPWSNLSPIAREGIERLPKNLETFHLFEKSTYPGDLIHFEKEDLKLLPYSLRQISLPTPSSWNE